MLFRCYGDHGGSGQDADSRECGECPHDPPPAEAVEDGVGDWRQGEDAHTGAAEHEAGGEGAPPGEVGHTGHHRREVDQAEAEAGDHGVAEDEEREAGDKTGRQEAECRHRRPRHADPAAAVEGDELAGEGDTE